MEEVEQLILALSDESHYVKNRALLVEALRDLAALVGMVELKRAVVDQLLFFLANIRAKGVAKATDGHMLHTVIYGPPGVGKSVVGSILARIWSSLGILKEPESSEEPVSARLQLAYFQSLTSERLVRVGTALEATKAKVRELRSRLFAAKARSRRRKNQDESPRVELERLEEELQRLSRLSSDVLSYASMASASLVSSPPASTRSLPAPATRVEDLFRVVSRSEFVAEYLGQSAPKTKKLLDSHRGKVLMVDEAYSLYQGDRDSFGAEALTVINQYMSEHADSTVLIFAGYEPALRGSVFKAQPGLVRRIAYTFRIPGYSPLELARIFLLQLQQDGWQFDGELEALARFFETHAQQFKSYGGDTKRLILQCKMTATVGQWQAPTLHQRLTLPLVEQAFERYRANQPVDVDRLDLFESPAPVYEEEATLQRIREFEERRKHEELYARARTVEREELAKRVEKPQGGREARSEIQRAARRDCYTLMEELAIARDDGVKLFCGQYSTFVRREDGSLWATGFTGDGDLGLGDRNSRYALTPVPVPTGVVNVALGEDFTIAHFADGTVMVTGTNEYQQLRASGSYRFVTAATRRPVLQVACGIRHSILLLEDGSLSASGSNQYGQLGVDTSPQPLSVAHVVCGSYRSFLLLEDGRLFACGHNYYGQLGLGDVVDRRTLTTIPVPFPVTQAACGRQHTVILSEEGKVAALREERLRILGATRLRDALRLHSRPYFGGSTRGCLRCLRDLPPV